MSRIEWLTVATNRTRVKRGFDGGRSSWKLHAVRLEDDQKKLSDIPKGTVTVCGIWHACGFDLNVLITDRCKSCERILAKSQLELKYGQLDHHHLTADIPRQRYRPHVSGGTSRKERAGLPNLRLRRPFRSEKQASLQKHRCVSFCRWGPHLPFGRILWLLQRMLRHHQLRSHSRNGRWPSARFSACCKERHTF